MTALALGLLAAFATFVAGVGAAIAIGKATNSGLVGSCGPYGPHANLVGVVFLGSFPVSVVAGAYVGRRTYQHLTHIPKDT